MKNVNEPEPLISYDDYVLEKFKEDPILAQEMVIEGIKEYKADGDISFVLLNLSRIVMVRGYGEFEEGTDLKRAMIYGVLKGKMPLDKALINKMLEVLDIGERI